MQTNQRAAFKSRFEKGAAVIRATGPVTRDTLRALRAEVFAAVMMNDVDRLLCDFSGAVLTLSPDEWAAYGRDCASQHAVGVAQGFLVGAEAVEQARSHCDYLNAHGRVCLAFLTSSSAYRWLGVPALSARPPQPSEAVQD